MNICKYTTSIIVDQQMCRVSKESLPEFQLSVSYGCNGCQLSFCIESLNGNVSLHSNMHLGPFKHMHTQVHK